MNNFSIIFFFSILSTLSFAATDFKIAFEDADNSPYSYISKSKPEGFHIDLIKEALGEASNNVTFIAVPWLRILAIAQQKLSNETNKFSAVTYISPNEERNKFFYFHPDNVLHTEKLCFMVRNSALNSVKYDGTIKSLKKLKFIFPKGYHISDEVEQAKKYLDYTDFSGTFANTVEMFDNERMQVSVLPKSYIFDERNKDLMAKFQEKKISLLKPCINGSKRYVAFLKNKKTYLQDAEYLAKKIKAFKKTPEYKNLLIKYKLN